jgi:hypothetical protein
MAVKYLGDATYQCLSTDTKPVSGVAVDALFLETDTRRLLTHAGSGVYNEISSPTSNVWTVYQAGSVYKAKSNTGLTPQSSSNLKTVWDAIKSSPAARTRIHFLNATNPYDIPSGSTLDLPIGQHYHVSGESMHGVRLRPLGNDIAMTITNSRHYKVEGLQFYSDQGATYTSDFLRIIGTTGGGCESIELSNIKMRHDDGGSTLFQTGRNLVLLLTGTDADISWTNVHDCHFYGGENTICLTSSSGAGSIWCQEASFTRVHGTHSKRYFLASMEVIGGSITNSTAGRLIFRDCAWQTTAVEATTLDMFNFSTDVSHRRILIDGCMMWDPDSTNCKFLTVNSSDIRLMVRDSEPTGDVFMGGTKWDASTGSWNDVGAQITRDSERTARRGVSIQSGNGSTTVFNIAHGVKDYVEAGTTTNVTPKFFDAKPRSSAANAAYTITATSTNIVLTYAVAPANAANNLTWQWEARQYV